MEFPATGGVYNSWVVRTAKLLRYVSDFDFAIMALECLYCLFIIYYTLEELYDVSFLIKCILINTTRLKAKYYRIFILNNFSFTDKSAQIGIF